MTLSRQTAQAAQRPPGRTRCDKHRLSQLHDTRLEPPCTAPDHFTNLYVPVFAAQEDAPARTMPADICFPSCNGSPTDAQHPHSLVTRAPGRRLASHEVCTPSAPLRAGSFRLGISTLRWPYPSHYGDKKRRLAAFAFSDILYPLRLPLSLRSGYHSPDGCGAHRAYLRMLFIRVDCRGDALRLGWRLCSRWGLWVLLPAAILRQSAPRYHFWSRPISLFGRFRLTRCTTLHICSTFRCFPRPPPPRG